MNNTFKKFCEDCDLAIQLIVKLVVIIIVMVIAVVLINKHRNKPIAPAIDTVNVVKANDSLKTSINRLDSIKNEKATKVKSLNNDSTIKLFYQLIK